MAFMVYYLKFPKEYLAQINSLVKPPEWQRILTEIREKEKNPLEKFSQIQEM